MCKKSNLIICFVFLLTSCAMRVVAYKWADTYLLSELDNAFDLNRDQKESARKAVKELMQWHSQSEIPKYILFLSEVRVRANQRISESDLNWAYQSIISFGKNIAVKSALIGTPLLLTLDKTQIDNLEHFQKKRNEKRFKYLKLGRQIFTEKKSQKLEEYAKEWLGKLNANQISIIKKDADKLWQFENQRYKNALLSQGHFRDALNSKNKEEIEHTIRSFFNFPQPFHTNEYQIEFVKYQEITKKLILKLQKESSQNQLDFFVKKVVDLQNDLKEMQSVTF